MYLADLLLRFMLVHDCTPLRQQETAEAMRSLIAFLSVSEKSRPSCHNSVRQAQQADHVVGG